MNRADAKVRSAQMEAKAPQALVNGSWSWGRTPAPCGPCSAAFTHKARRAVLRSSWLLEPSLFLMETPLGKSMVIAASEREGGSQQGSPPSSLLHVSVALFLPPRQWVSFPLRLLSRALSLSRARTPLEWVVEEVGFR